MLSTLRAGIEYLSGERDDAPLAMQGQRWILLAQCLVWVFTMVLIYAFSGQSSKFIYIDF